MASSSHAAFHMEALRRQRIIDRAAMLQSLREEKQQEKQKDATTQTEKQMECSSYQSSEKQYTSSQMSSTSRCSQQTSRLSTGLTSRTSCAGQTSKTSTVGRTSSAGQTSRTSSAGKTSRVSSAGKTSRVSSAGSSKAVQQSNKSSGGRSRKSSEKHEGTSERYSIVAEKSPKGGCSVMTGEAEIPRKRKRVTSQQKPQSAKSLKEALQTSSDPSSLPQSAQSTSGQEKSTSRSHSAQLKESGVSE